MVLGWIAVGFINLFVNSMNITRGFHESQFEFAHVRREMASDFDGNSRIYDGYYGGTVERGGKTYHHVQFPGVLIGEGRQLNILFPETILDEAIIFESDERIDGSQGACLTYQHYCCVVMETSNLFLDQEPGTASDPVLIMKENFGRDITPPDGPYILCSMDFCNIYDQTIQCILWERSDSGGMTVAAKGGSIGMPYDMDIEWTVRNRETFRFRKLIYAAAVVADVVTGPVQLAFWAIVGPSIVR